MTAPHAQPKPANPPATLRFEGGEAGFIGLGVMGKSLARHLLRAGYAVAVFNRTRARAQPLLEAGAQWAESPAALATRCRIVFTMLGFPHDVEEIYFGPRGLLAHAAQGALFVDLTTSSPALARRIAAEAAARGASALDAPVTGGDVGAREARLSIMVGGDAGAFTRAEAALKLFGPTIIHHGPAGSGQHAKLCNQIMIAATMMGVCESLAFARAAGLDPERVLQSTGGGAAASWSLQNLVPRVLRGDFAPGFFVKHFVKDLRLALETARDLKLNLPGLTLAERLYSELAAGGHADSGTQALWKWYEANHPHISRGGV